MLSVLVGDRLLVEDFIGLIPLRSIAKASPNLIHTVNDSTTPLLRTRLAAKALLIIDPVSDLIQPNRVLLNLLGLLHRVR